jgi:hypothetical protein
VGDDDAVIVVVVGPSAAGKTTWCRRHLPVFVSKYIPTGSEPDGTDPVAQAAYWVSVNSGRWDQALALARETGLAVYDSDPLKLHYSWCLSRIGAAPWARFEHELAQVRQAFADETLGLAGLVLVSIPTIETRRQRDADPTAADGPLSCTFASASTSAPGTKRSMHSNQGASSGTCHQRACRPRDPNLALGGQTSPCSTRSRHHCRPCKRHDVAAPPAPAQCPLSDLGSRCTPSTPRGWRPGLRPTRRSTSAQRCRKSNTRLCPGARVQRALSLTCPPTAIICRLPGPGARCALRVTDHGTPSWSRTAPQSWIRLAITPTNVQRGVIGTHNLTGC